MKYVLAPFLVFFGIWFIGDCAIVAWYEGKILLRSIRFHATVALNYLRGLK
jgi:hypothetical protein